MKPEGMKLVRTWLPIAIIVAGFVVAIATGFSENGVEGGTLLVAAGLSVWLLNLLYRVGVKGDRERDEEDRARAYFDEHGYWPGEEPPQSDPHRQVHRHKPVDSVDDHRRRR
jgi:hypothetical protein